MLRDGPPLHRVIPVDTAIPFEVEIFPYERASALLGAASSWGVRDCICRVQKGLIGESCGRPVEACLVFAPVENAFANSPDIRSLSRDEALDVLREAGEAGLIHSSGNYRRGIHYICNCCTCCCGVMRGMSEFGIHDAVARSGSVRWSMPRSVLAAGRHGRLAQPVEHLLYTEGVGGSSPSPPTTPRQVRCRRARGRGPKPPRHRPASLPPRARGVVRSRRGHRRRPSPRPRPDGPTRPQRLGASASTTRAAGSAAATTAAARSRCRAR
jgi:hypothetical protein